MNRRGSETTESFADRGEEAETEASDRQGGATSRPTKNERAIARAYWRLWRRNWRPPFRQDDRPAGDA